MSVIAFQVFKKHTAVIARSILNYAQCHQEQFCMLKECIFQTEMKQNIKETIFGNLNE
jgi:hypothetical protein